MNNYTFLLFLVPYASYKFYNDCVASYSVGKYLFQP